MQVHMCINVHLYVCASVSGGQVYLCVWPYQHTRGSMFPVCTHVCRCLCKWEGVQGRGTAYDEKPWDGNGNQLDGHFRVGGYLGNSVRLGSRWGEVSEIICSLEDTRGSRTAFPEPTEALGKGVTWPERVQRPTVALPSRGCSIEAGREPAAGRCISEGEGRMEKTGCRSSSLGGL